MAQEMKDSGIEWIGKIPANWQVCKQKHVIELINGRAYSDDEFEDGGKYRILRVGNLFTNPAWYTSSMELDSSKYCEDGDLLYAWSMSYAPVIWHGEKVIYHYHIWKVDLSILIDKLFAFYYLKVVTDALMAEKHETTMSFITMGVMNNSYIAYPDISDQHRIAAFLDRKCAEIDSIIADTQKTIEEYKALKQSIITEAVTKGVRGERKMKDSGVEWIGDVPEEWEVIPVKYVAEFQPSCDMSNLTDDSIITYLPMEHLKNGYYIQNTAFYGSVASSLTPFMNGDIVMAKVTPCFENGNIAIMNDLSSGVGMGSSELFVYRPLDVQTKYLLYWLQNILFKQAACATMTGTGGLKRVSPYFAKHSKMTLPCYKEQLEIIRYLDEKCTSLDKLIESKQQLLTELESYKKSVIYEYVTGKKECGIAVAQVTQAAIVPFYPAAISTKRVRFAQAVLMAKVLDKCHKGMGRVKLEKTMYTIETIIGFDFETEYVRQVAGPLDESLYKCEGIISRVNHWYTVCASQHGVSYKPTKNADKYQSYYCRYFGNYNTEIERIIDIFASYTTEQAEVIATLLAAWNDAIIEGKSFTDTDIVNDVLNNWSEEKKRFSKDVWLRAMDELRKKDLIPKGYGKKTVRRNIK